MVFRQSADFQCNEEPEKHGCVALDYDMYVIKQTVEETLRWYNFQIAGHGRVALHLYASLVRRFEVSPSEQNLLEKLKAGISRQEFEQEFGGMLSLFGNVHALLDSLWKFGMLSEEEAC